MLSYASSTFEFDKTKLTGIAPTRAMYYGVVVAQYARKKSDFNLQTKELSFLHICILPVVCQIWKKLVLSVLNFDIQTGHLLA